MKTKRNFLILTSLFLYVTPMFARPAIIQNEVAIDPSEIGSVGSPGGANISNPCNTEAWISTISVNPPLDWTSGASTTFGWFKISPHHSRSVRLDSSWGTQLFIFANNGGLSTTNLIPNRYGRSIAGCIENASMNRDVVGNDIAYTCATNAYYHLVTTDTKYSNIELSCVNDIPISSRTRWGHAKGFFQNEGGDNWTEYTSDQSRIFFKEVESNSTYKLLYDSNRDLYVKLEANASYWKVGINGTWYMLYSGVWSR